VSRPPGVPTNATPVRQQAGYTIWVNGAERTRLRDAYHTFLRLRWSYSLAAIALGFFVVNVIFAVIYLMVGGLDGVRHGSFFDSLMFSVETLGTIGYGVMHPSSGAASVVVIVESITGIIITALITGLVFSKFARATARIAFSRTAVICNHEGKQTLMFRCGNERSNVIVEAKMHVVLSMTKVDERGEQFYKIYDLPLHRDRMGGMRRGWTVRHTIDDKSPLFGLDAEAITKGECEIEVALMGFDDVTLQTVYALHQYNDKQILIGHRLVDTLTIFDNGDLMFDMTKFHDTVVDDAPASTSPF
jgi:inward rectifier potassium channel